MPSAFHRAIGRPRPDTARDIYARHAHREAGQFAIHARQTMFGELTAINAEEAIRYQQMQLEFCFNALMAEYDLKEKR